MSLQIFSKLSSIHTPSTIHLNAIFSPSATINPKLSRICEIVSGRQRSHCMARFHCCYSHQHRPAEPIQGALCPYVQCHPIFCFHLLLPHFAFLTSLYCKLFSTNARSCATNFAFEVILMLLFQMDNAGNCKKETLRRRSYCPAHCAKGDSHKPTEAPLKGAPNHFRRHRLNLQVPLLTLNQSLSTLKKRIPTFLIHPFAEVNL